MWSVINPYDIVDSESSNFKGVISKYFEPDNNNNMVISKKYRNIEFKLREEYDGCDSNGPQSHIYDLWVTWNDKKYKEQNDVWHREFWYDEEDDDEFKMMDHNDYYLSNLMYSYVRRNNHLN